MKNVGFLSLALVAAVGCNVETASTGSERTPTVITDGATPAQLDAFRALESTTNLSWSWVQHPELRTPMHLSAPRTGNPILRQSSGAVQVTLDVLKQHKALFRMHDPAAELVSKHTHVDELGMTHARFQQTVRGVPVSGAELMAHYDRVGRLTSIDANYVPDLDGIDVNPALTIDEALGKAHADVLARSPADASTLETTLKRLVVYAANEHLASPKLAYEYRVKAMKAKLPAIWVVIIDAKTGEVLHRYSDLETIAASGTGVLGDTKQFEVTQGGSGFVMSATVNGIEHRTLTSQQQEAAGTDVVSSVATSWDTGVVGQGAAVDAHFFATKVSAYYRTAHQRNAVDGSGGALLSTVHYAQGLDNAFWDGTGMYYGDGARLFRPLCASLDVVGHEFTHGVTGSSSNLNYENQSGALNEAVSDIFGCFIAHAVQPDPVKNWQLGTSASLSGGPIRDMANPQSVAEPQPANMSTFVNTSEDNGGVHTNSGIINNAAYLMTMGGSNPVSQVRVAAGIGFEKSEKLWYRANTKYFMTTTNFGQAAQGVLQAAQDVGFTQNEINIVDCAFKAVGVAQGECGAIVDTSSTTPTPTPAPTSGPSSGDTGDDPSTPSTPKTHRRLVVTQSSSGCNASGSSGELGSLFGIGLALTALAVTRRKRPC